MNILVTGGASGLGEAITRRLAADWQNTVWFTYNNSSASARELAGELANTRAVKCDFTHPQDVEELKKRLPEFDLDVLVNNVYTGKAIKTYFHKIDPEDFATDFNNTVIPTIHITQAAIAHFRKKKQGRIITILTSFLLNTPPSGSAVYVANKAYLEMLFKVWATENIKYNITSNAVSPAFMQTAFTADTDERVIDQMTESHPLKKLLSAAEVADAVHYLAAASSQLNGVNLAINAGVNLK